MSGQDLGHVLLPVDPDLGPDSEHVYLDNAKDQQLTVSFVMLVNVQVGFVLFFGLFQLCCALLRKLYPLFISMLSFQELLGLMSHFSGKIEQEHSDKIAG